MREKRRDDAALEDNNPDLTDAKRARRIVRKIDLYILPICAWIYLLNYLDRGNIGNTKVLNEETGDSLLQRTGMTNTNYAVAVSLFSLAYALFEVPSNLIMKRYVRPSRWLATLLFCWGAFTIGFAGVQNYASVVVLRFFVGVFEAGFFPGTVYLITFWYPVAERSVPIAFVLASATAAGAFGGCIAYGVGQHLNDARNLSAFRWLFIIEGLVTVCTVPFVLLLLPDYPSRARFLSPSDKKFVSDRVRAGVGGGGGYTSAKASRSEVLETCLSPRMLAHYLAYLTNSVALGSLTFFTPTIVAGLGYTSVRAQLMTVPPWAVGYVVCLALSYSADRRNARGLHVALSSAVGGAGWLAAGCLPSDAYGARYGCLMLCACGAFPSCGPLSAWVTCNVPSVVTMGVATALNNSVAGVSQIVAQWIWREGERAAGYPTGNFVCAGCSFATAVVAAGLRWWYGRLNGRRRRSGGDGGVQERIWLL